LEHAALASYNRTLADWSLNQDIYQQFVLRPIIESPAIDSRMPANLNWRCFLWEDFYPRVRHESSPADAAAIVAFHLRERITVVTSSNAPHEIAQIWSEQVTDEMGFDVIYVAALRSVGIPARLASNRKAEFWDGVVWREAPRPPLLAAN